MSNRAVLTQVIARVEFLFGPKAQVRCRVDGNGTVDVFRTYDMYAGISTPNAISMLAALDKLDPEERR